MSFPQYRRINWINKSNSKKVLHTQKKQHVTNGKFDNDQIFWPMTVQTQTKLRLEIVPVRRKGASATCVRQQAPSLPCPVKCVDVNNTTLAGYTILAKKKT